MEIAYIVEPMSALDIELDSAKFLKEYQPDTLLSDKPLNVEKLLDDVYLATGVTLQLVDDKELPREILGVSEMDTKIIKIRDVDFEKCDTDGYQRMTITHEAGHPRLHLNQFEKNGMKMYRTQSNYIPPYRSSEWQARVWASATMMPFPAMVRLLYATSEKTETEVIDAIMERFIVSRAAAEARYSTLLKYYKDGRYHKIEKSMKELCFM